jgi:hypothetical protein
MLRTKFARQIREKCLNGLRNPDRPETNGTNSQKGNLAFSIPPSISSLFESREHAGCWIESILVKSEKATNIKLPNSYIPKRKFFPSLSSSTFTSHKVHSYGLREFSPRIFPDSFPQPRRRRIWSSPPAYHGLVGGWEKYFHLQSHGKREYCYWGGNSWW